MCTINEYKYIDPLSSPQMYIQSSNPSKDRQISIIRSQLENVRRTVLQVQQIENDLSTKLDYIAGGNTLPYEEFKQKRRTLLQNSQNEQETGEDTDDTEIPYSSMITNQLLLDREIRLFVSSPFVDMQKERDILVMNSILFPYQLIITY